MRSPLPRPRARDTAVASSTADVSELLEAAASLRAAQALRWGAQERPEPPDGPGRQRGRCPQAGQAALSTSCDAERVQAREREHEARGVEAQLVVAHRAEVVEQLPQFAAQRGGHHDVQLGRGLRRPARRQRFRPAGPKRRAPGLRPRARPPARGSARGWGPPSPGSAGIAAGRGSRTRARSLRSGCFASRFSLWSRMPGQVCAERSISSLRNAGGREAVRDAASLILLWKGDLEEAWGLRSDSSHSGGLRSDPSHSHFRKRECPAKPTRRTSAGPAAAGHRQDGVRSEEHGSIALA